MARIMLQVQDETHVVVNLNHTALSVRIALTWSPLESFEECFLKRQLQRKLLIAERIPWVKSPREDARDMHFDSYVRRANPSVRAIPTDLLPQTEVLEKAVDCRQDSMGQISTTYC